MGYDLWTEEDRARRKFLDASENYCRLQDRYFPMHAGVDGRKIRVGMIPTTATLQEIRESINRLEETFAEWDKVARRVVGDYR